MTKNKESLSEWADRQRHIADSLHPSDEKRIHKAVQTLAPEDRIRAEQILRELSVMPKDHDNGLTKHDLQGLKEYTVWS